MEQIGRYLVRERLGRGGFAVVYRAEDPLVDTDVAIKVLAEHHADDPDIRARFVDEARVMRRIRSDRIVTIYDIAELPDGRPYIVMQLAERGTLDDRLAELRSTGHRVEPADVTPLVRGLGEALAAMHAAGVVHRDVKPSNVLISTAPHGATDARPTGARLIRYDEYIILGDLGVAKALDSTGRLTVLAGTQPYMAPEQRAVGARIDGRADLYAATALMIEVLYGGDAPALDLRSMIADLDVSKRLATELRRGTATAPADRHPDAHRWADAVLAGSSPGPEPGSAEPAAGSRRTRRWLVAVLVVLFVAAGIAAIIARSGGASVSIVGPAQLTVGQTGAFYADGVDGTDWSWVGPDGTLRRGEVLRVVAGDDDLTVSVDQDGDRVASRRIDVVSADPDVTISGPSQGRIGEEIELRGSAPAGAEMSWTVRDENVEGDVLRLRLQTPGVIQVDLNAVVASTTRRAMHAVTVLPP